MKRAIGVLLLLSIGAISGLSQELVVFGESEDGSSRVVAEWSGTLGTPRIESEGRTISLEKPAEKPLTIGGMAFSSKHDMLLINYIQPPAKFSDNYLYAFALSTGKTLWKLHLNCDFFVDPAFVDDRIVVAKGDSGMILTLDLDGQELSSFRAFNAGMSNMTVRSGRFYCIGTDIENRKSTCALKAFDSDGVMLSEYTDYSRDDILVIAHDPDLLVIYKGVWSDANLSLFSIETPIGARPRLSIDNGKPVSFIELVEKKAVIVTVSIENDTADLKEYDYSGKLVDEKSFAIRNNIDGRNQVMAYIGKLRRD